MSNNTNGPLRVGVGGPVGSGKTALMDRLCKSLRDKYEIAGTSPAMTAGGRRERNHDLNSRVYCVSCRSEARSARNADAPMSSSAVTSARCAVAATTGSSAATTRWPSV